MKKLLYLQHVPDEPPGMILDWADERNIACRGISLYQGAPLPPLEGIDFVVVMGGSMGVYDHDANPWLKAEKAFLAEAIHQGIPMLGICLGAQLIAHVLGGAETRNPFKEFGYFPLALTQDGIENALLSDSPKTLTPFHWHGDTFAIPKGSVHIAQNSACTNQGFIGPGPVVGLQFHIETDTHLIRSWLDAHGPETPASDLGDDGRFIQSPEAIRTVAKAHTAVNRGVLYSILDRLFV